MQFLTLASVLFAAGVIALPTEQAQQGKQTGQWDSPWNNNGPFDGDENGIYQQSCVCVRQGVVDFGLTTYACNELGAAYPNLRIDNGFGGQGGCIDLAGRGIEQNGFRAACQRQAGPFDVIDVQCGGGPTPVNPWQGGGGRRGRGW